MNKAPDSASSTTLAVGIMMIVAATLSVVLMAHHPTGMHSMGALGGLVHGGMMLVLTLLFVGFTHYSILCGLHDLRILTALVIYGVSTVAHLGAATINGFVVPALASRGDGAISHDVFVFAWESNQALALIGVIATGIAYCCWSLPLLLQSALSRRLLGDLGLAAGALPALALMSGRYGMDVDTALLVYLAHALFSAAIGAMMLRDRRAAA